MASNSTDALSPHVYNVGRADSTIAADNAALKCFNTYRRVSLEKGTFDEMPYVEIEVDNFQNSIADFAEFLRTTPIPRNYTGDFDPPASAQDSDEPIRVITSAVLSGYIGKIVKLHHLRYPGHEDFHGLDKFKNTDVPQWWTDMRVRFIKDCDRYHLSINGEYVSGETAKRPIYRINGLSGITAEDWNDANIRDFISLIDLVGIVKSLTRKASASQSYVIDGPLQHRLLVVTTYLCAGRGGEAKFVDFNKWMYHPPYGCVDIVWTEAKTLKKYAMPMVSDKSQWSCDFFHALASYFMCEGGLIRTGEQAPIENFLFVNLHKKKNETVTKKITSIIRSNLPRGTPDELKNDVSAKSLRIGSVSHLTVHRDLNNMTDVTGRSGHSTGTSVDSYADERNMFRALRENFHIFYILNV